jgi:putative hydrolases of HD superfamily
MSDFTDDVMRLFRTLHPLDQVPRAGYLLRGVASPESVAAHSHFVALLALLFVEKYPGRFDRYRALAMALVHDLSETRLMDIPMPYADAYLKEAKRQAEQTILEEMMTPFPGDLAALHQEFSDAQTPEARLLRGLDKAQMMLKILNYEAEHRGRLEEFWHNPKNFDDFGLPEVSELFEAVCEKAGRSRPR